jgi:hypothetical protein
MKKRKQEKIVLTRMRKRKRENCRLGWGYSWKYKVQNSDFTQKVVSPTLAPMSPLLSTV